MNAVPTFGERMRELRTAAGLEQKQLAFSLRVAQSVVSTWERRTRAPRPETVRRIAGALGRPVSDLLAGVPTGYESEADRRVTDPVSPADESGEIGGLRPVSERHRRVLNLINGLPEAVLDRLEPRLHRLVADALAAASEESSSAGPQRAGRAR